MSKFYNEYISQYISIRKIPQTVKSKDIVYYFDSDKTELLNYTAAYEKNSIYLNVNKQFQQYQFTAVRNKSLEKYNSKNVLSILLAFPFREEVLKSPMIVSDNEKLIVLHNPIALVFSNFNDASAAQKLIESENQTKVYMINYTNEYGRIFSSTDNSSNKNAPEKWFILLCQEDFADLL